MTSPTSPMATLRINVRQSLQPRGIRHHAVSSAAATSVATIRFANATFRSRAGLDLSHRDGVQVSFPDDHSLQITVNPRSHLVGQDGPAVFSPLVVVLNNLALHLNDGATAISGELTHSPDHGELAFTITGSDCGSVLPADLAARFFAVKLPPNAGKN